MSKDMDLKLLNNLKERYGLGLFEIENKDFKQQLREDEMFLQATKTGYDRAGNILNIVPKEVHDFIKQYPEKRPLVE